MGSINQFLKELGSGTSIKDYKHASRIFVDDNYRLAPKHAFLFHVAFDLNSEISRIATPNDTTRQKILELGMLVKSVNLPKYTIDTKTYNAYNRVNIVQNKIKYDPVTITFHDDSADVVRQFWYDYMSYYYRDSDYSEPSYAQSGKYNTRLTQDWGYKPARYGASATSVERMIRGIRIYSLHQKRFTEYVLINPTITSFQHGQHVNGANETLENTMTLSFETVLYKAGWVLPGNTIDYAMLHYDTTPSPLTPQGGGTNSILGPGGLLNAADSIVSQLGQTDENGNPMPNVLGAGLTAYKAFQNFQNMNLSQSFGAELTQIGKDVLMGNNPLNRLFIPTAAGYAGQGAMVSGAGLFGTNYGQPTSTYYGQQNGMYYSQGGYYGQMNGASPMGMGIAGLASGIVGAGIKFGSKLFGSDTNTTTATSNGQALAPFVVPNVGKDITNVVDKEDGTKVVSTRDGYTTTINPDGTKKVVFPNGTVTNLDANNQVVEQVLSTPATNYDTNSASDVAPYVDAPTATQTTNMNSPIGLNQSSSQGDATEESGT